MTTAFKSRPSAFAKAAPQQARLKMSLYGLPGSGKTFSTLLMAEGLAAMRNKRIAYVDTERGTDFYSQHVAARRVHPAAFDFDALYTRSLKETLDAVMSLDPREHGVIVVDSISHLWDAAIDAYTGKQTRIGTIPMSAWGPIKKPYKKLIDFLIGSPFDVFILGRQKNVFEDDSGSDKIKKAGVTMRAESDTQHEPHICLRMEAIRIDKTNVEYCCYVEKDRTGVLAGQVLVNPGFAAIEPLVGLLGGQQAASEDSEQRVARDGSLIEDEAPASRSDHMATKLRSMMAAPSIDVEELGNDIFQGIAAATTIQELDAAVYGAKNLDTKRKDIARGLYITKKAAIEASTFVEVEI